MIRVAELFEILVDHHGLAVREAVAALVATLERAGYPPDAPEVDATDGLTMIRAILDGRR